MLSCCRKKEVASPALKGRSSDSSDEEPIVDNYMLMKQQSDRNRRLVVAGTTLTALATAGALAYTYPAVVSEGVSLLIRNASSFSDISVIKETVFKILADHGIAIGLSTTATLLISALWNKISRTTGLGNLLEVGMKKNEVTESVEIAGPPTIEVTYFPYHYFSRAVGIGSATLAACATGYLAYQNTEAINEGINLFLRTINSSLNASQLNEMLMGYSKEVITGLTAIFASLTAYLATPPVAYFALKVIDCFFHSVKKMFIDLPIALLKTIASAVATGASTIYNGIVNILAMLVNGIKETFSAIARFCYSMITKAIEGIKFVGTTMANGMVSIARFCDSVIAKIKAGLASIAHFCYAMATKTIEGIKLMGTAIASGITFVFNKLVDCINAIAKGIKDLAIGCGKAVVIFYTTILNALKAIGNKIHEYRFALSTLVIAGMIANPNQVVALNTAITQLCEDFAAMLQGSNASA